MVNRRCYMKQIKYYKGKKYDRNDLHNFHVYPFHDYFIMIIIKVGTQCTDKHTSETGIIYKYKDSIGSVCYIKDDFQEDIKYRKQNKYFKQMSPIFNNPGPKRIELLLHPK